MKFSADELTISVVSNSQILNKDIFLIFSSSEPHNFVFTVKNVLAQQKLPETFTNTTHVSQNESNLSYHIIFEILYKHTVIYFSQVFFFCLNEPAEGCSGETPLAENSELLSKLDPDVLQKFEEKQIRYVRYLPYKSPGEHFKWMTWQETFTTENKEVLKVSLVVSFFS